MNEAVVTIITPSSGGRVTDAQMQANGSNLI